MSTLLKEILSNGTDAEKKALFQFSSQDNEERILLKFNLWARYFMPQYFESPDAPFHEDINRNNLQAYRGALDYFVDIAFRGAGKDVKTKLFIAYTILNDTEHTRKYYKILSADLTNARQSVTDIYNMFVNPRVIAMYPDTLQKTQYKREEQMGSFTTASGIKVIADTVGTEQRGAIQEATRPDFVWLNDFETRKTLRSAIITRAIWDNMEEARTGLQKGGAMVFTCNYISELGNVHRLVTEKKSPRKKVLIVPIRNDDGVVAWSRYTKEDIAEMERTDDDFEGERLCKPSASRDVLFDRERLDAMPTPQPKRESAGFKIFKEFDPSHRYGSGHDVAGGVGLDSSTSVFIDFDVVPAQVVGTFYSNTLQPEPFGAEVYREGQIFGGCIQAIENNKFDQAILKARQMGANLFMTQPKDTKVDHTMPTTYGWNTNSLTKPKMLLALAKAIEDGFIQLNDPDLIQEARSYSRNDLMDREEDPRLTTRHFDLLTACAIAWQMKDFAFNAMINRKQHKTNVKLTKWG
jgi:hypothetical protein